MKNEGRKRCRLRSASGHPPRVLLVIPTANIIHRHILNGILRYAHQYGPWEFHMITGLFEEQGIRRTKEWGCTGAIAFTETKAHVSAVLAAAVPVIFINPPGTLMGAKSPLSHHCCVIRDHGAVGRSAADYFLDRQYASFAYVGDVRNMPWSFDRAKGFVERVSQQGFSCEIYPELTQNEREDFGLESKRLRLWLRKLPKPVAVMAARDQRARQILEMCMDEGISVPHEIAVLGVGNDEILCETTTPSLSSIELDGENTGYECAKLLDGRMRLPAAAAAACRVSLSQARVITRRSTDISCIADPHMAKALAFIRAGLGTRLTVAQVARHTNISQRLLEMKSRQTLGRTVRDEIQRQRLNHARALLRNSQKTVSEIAAECGFCDPSHLGLWFRKTFRLTPTAFRASFRSDRP
ncbi:MAG: substrate-binding domain-containing protein [Lentisphaerae bacterium]|nr:substrate-binding domain-containing protein [Lentisphaerota bacterium]